MTWTGTYCPSTPYTAPGKRLWLTCKHKYQHRLGLTSGSQLKKKEERQVDRIGIHSTIPGVIIMHNSTDCKLRTCFTSVPWDSMMTTQQSCCEWSFLDKSDSSCLICWKHRDDCQLYNHKLKGFYVISGRWNDSHSLFQVCLDFHNEVECLEPLLQLVAVYVGPFSTAQLTLGFKLHVVYDEAMSAGAGIHFIALTDTHMRIKRKQRRICGKNILLVQHLFNSVSCKLHDKWMVLTWMLSRRILPSGLGLMYSFSGAVAWPSICVQHKQTYNIVTNK